MARPPQAPLSGFAGWHRWLVRARSSRIASTRCSLFAGSRTVSRRRCSATAMAHTAHWRPTLRTTEAQKNKNKKKTNAFQVVHEGQLGDRALAGGWPLSRLEHGRLCGARCSGEAQPGIPRRATQWHSTLENPQADAVLLSVQVSRMCFSVLLFAPLFTLRWNTWTEQE